MSDYESREAELTSGEHADEPERVYETCIECDGAGENAYGGEWVDCRNCKGLGRVDITEWVDEPYYEPQARFL